MSSATASHLSIERTMSGTVRVAPGKWRLGIESDLLYTREIGACIGIAVYDAATKISHMAHIYSTDGSQKEILDPLIESVGRHSSALSNLRGWVRGGSSEANIPAWVEPGLLLRTKAVARLGELGLRPGENLDVAWNDDESLLLHMSLDCDAGECLTTQLSMSPA